MDHNSALAEREPQDIRGEMDRTRESMTEKLEVLENQVLGTVQTTIEPNSPINYQALQTLQDVSAAAHSVKELADYLQRNPSAIVRGRDFSQD